MEYDILLSAHKVVKFVKSLADMKTL